MPCDLAEKGPMYDLVSLGEVMLRYSPPKYERLCQATCLDVRVCGAEFNVAADLACLGGKSALISKLPASELGRLALRGCLSYGVDITHIKMVPNARIGVVYVEFGTEPRGGVHLYDRQHSAASTLSPDDFAWLEILKNARLAYTDGIFPGLSQCCRDATWAFLRTAREQGCKVCFDMNYRTAIWRSDQARDMYIQNLPAVDILVTNRSVSQSVLGFRGSDEDLLRCYHGEFGCQTVCLTSRVMEGTRRGTWKSMALHENRITYGRPFQFDVVDRFGTGDAFFAGFLFQYLAGDIQFALDFGNALCALAHTIEGDVVQISAEEVTEQLDGGRDFEIRR